ncbi:uncharacterized protein LOC116180749 [Photinus pyralis]|uniref:uncharacterized protein LOC116180749 n=1 Tax=Photinus pyralis TaxID=7054 RepID=UPI0012670117|nr:uncharacterized protein LOC116180749 [Photinus pyralis]
MQLRFVVLCLAFAAVKAGYLQPALRYGGAIGFAAPSVARVEHLAPAVASVHRTETYTAPIARTSLIAPAVHSIAATPLIHHAPILRTGYLGHNFGYGVTPLGANRAGW